MVKELREELNRQFIGKTPVDKSSLVRGPTESTIRDTFSAKMDNFVFRGFLIGSDLLGKAPWNPETYTVTIDGDTYYFRNVEGNITVPLNFIFYLLELSYLQGTTTGG
jgi:hypothetical protein